MDKFYPSFDYRREDARTRASQDRAPVFPSIARGPVGEFDVPFINGCYDCRVTGLQERVRNPLGKLAGSRSFDDLSGLLALESRTQNSTAPSQWERENKSIRLISYSFHNLKVGGFKVKLCRW